METLEMIAMTYDGKPYNTNRTLDSIPDDEQDHNGWWYLHGELQSIVGYDKAVTTNCKTAGYSRATVDWIEITGNEVIEVRSEKPRWNICIDNIIPVKVDGIEDPCIGFFWTEKKRNVKWNGKEYPFWYQHGLVCLARDIESCEYARKRYDERPIIL